TIGTRLAADIHAIDTTRPVTIGTNKFIGGAPAAGPAGAQSVQLLDGAGMHYSNAKTLDSMHPAFPTKFIFQSKAGPGRSPRGSYWDPDALQTGDDYTPGQIASSAYGNAMSSFGTPVEAVLKAERDRPYLLGATYWAGMDYQGEAGFQQPQEFPWHVN